MSIERVVFAPAAIELLHKLYAIHHKGFMFHQSGGCCDGSAPMCYEAGEFRVGGSDVLLGIVNIDGIPEPINFYMSLEQFEYWKHTQLIIDAVPGRGSGFSMEAPEGMRFLLRSRLFDDAEWAELKTQPVLNGYGELAKV
jgi:uncharacterized protein (DUF779 family)